MRFQRIGIQNFLSFGSPMQFVDLDRRGLLAVFGQNKDSAASDSNGAGKSTVMEAIVWALFGETIRGHKSDAVIHRVVDKDCRVELTLEDEGVQYVITRTRKAAAKRPNDLILEINGQDASAGVMADTQGLVHTVLGMDQRTFTQSVLLRSKEKTFSQMTDKEQKEVLEDILHIEELSKAREKVKERLTERRNTLTKALARVEALDDQHHQAGIRMHKMVQSRDQHASYVLQKCAELKHKKIQVEADIEEKYLSTGLQKLLDSVENLDEHITSWNQEMVTYTKSAKDKTDNFTTKKMKISSDSGAVTAQKQSIEKDMKSVSKLAGTQCPTCCQQVDPTNSHKVLMEWQSKISDLKKTEDALQRKLDALLKKEKSERDSTQAWEDKARDTIKVLRDQRTEFQEQVSKRQHTLNVICQLEQEVFNLAQSIDDLKAEENPFTPLVGEIELEMTAVSRELRKWKYKEKALNLEISHLLYWDHGFGNQGLKTYVLENVIPFLTQRAQKYADILSGGDLQISFATQTQLKSGDWRNNFQVVVTNKQGSDVYAGNSDGEKRRIDMAVGWALGDLAATRAKKPIRFKGLDEPFENLDETGEDAVIKLLHSVLGQYETIMCITHSSHLRSQFPSDLTIVKENGFSTVL